MTQKPILFGIIISQNHRILTLERATGLLLVPNAVISQVASLASIFQPHNNNSRFIKFRWCLEMALENQLTRRDKGI
jgi:hypothetical protein